MTSLSPAAPGSSSECDIIASSSATTAADDPSAQNAGGQDNNTTVLTFSDVPSELFQLRSFDASQQRVNNGANGTNGTPANSHNFIDRPKSSTSQQSLSANDSSTAATTPASSSSHKAHPRKPSPGLAARLKALGFGNTRKSSSPPPSHHLEPVGRLPEEQLRSFDQDHQANSANTLVVERRGRPWKGIARIPAVPSLRSTKPSSKAEPEEAAVHEAASSEVKPEFLPELAASKPLEMDTHKYRLPDHTNGNGVKVQRETREEHLARDTRPPQSPDLPPPPLPKDTPPLPQGVATSPLSNDVFNPDSVSYFNPLGLQRPGSIYTLSRASFANQLAQLTSIQLPDAESLSSRVSAIPTAQAATRALIGAAEQIRGWIYKATEVIGGLESDDDVEWAAAGGREGVEEVENAILRFEELINVYVGAIEELQGRSDIGNVAPDDLRRAVAQMEAIVEEWAKIRNTLNSVKAQVEIAMEWEELWNMVLGDIQNEMDELSRLVFEMEERRHKSFMAASTGEGVDIGDLETIVEETPPAATRLQAVNNRFSLPALPVSPSSPSPGATGISLDDSSLLALFARMQPLRASLDFLPMRLSVFETRAERIFPTACEELEMRRSGLDASYKKLEKDAESLRKELGEDRWVLVFRGAGRQAQKMYESVEKSVAKLREGLDAGMHLTNQPVMSKKIESYEAKKMHYGPAIERVLAIIDKGVKDRLTVNGEILRLHNEMQAKWHELKERMAEIDATLEELQADKGQQLRDSISSMLSNDRSTIGSGNETPQSSPPSSVIMSSLGLSNPAPTVKAPKQRAASIGSHLPQPSNRRQSSLPAPSNQIQRKPLTPRLSALSTPTREGSTTPTGNRAQRAASTVPNRPRWNGSTNTADVDTGHNFKPLTLTTPSPYVKKTPTPVRSTSALTPLSGSKLPPMRSPLARAATASPVPEDTPTKLAATSRGLSFRERMAAASPGPRDSQLSLSLPQTQTSTPPRLTSHASSTGLSGNRRASLQPPRPNDSTSSLADTSPRPASSLASTHSRRTSMLPQPKARATAGSVTGRESPQAVAGARFAMRKNSTSSVDSKGRDLRPRWRG
ncbi:cortical protein KAR9-domain-containing protein [Diplogelasinospora grovesii]|uniref:Cortical protein KAR9-domain-containing protein n=1 Tax=Diplogelasinospora grovesii TaxID=303347 RepID=A0AAN6N3D0_9PEZI|nr:cortical protein KAR9-domain-containing protein [Diplogelasinospora grovesii]